MNSEQPSIVQKPGRRPARVVSVVEDDAGLRVALERVFRAAGYETRSYASAESALEDSGCSLPDCLVVDLRLPAMSGLDLIERLRRRGVSAPAVLMSANDEARVREEAGQMGVERFLAKPFLGSTLVGIVDDLLAAPARERARTGPPG